MSSLYDKKLSAAMNLLSVSGLADKNATPSGWKVIRSLGFKVPPPYFWGFKTTFIAYTLLFAIGFSAWEFIRHLFQNLPMSMPSWHLIIGGSLIFGLFLASRGFYLRLRFGLPLWRDIEPSP
jgi:Family of unknown function (DUF6404)